MTDRWLLVHLVRTSMALLPAFVQASESKPVPEPITPSLSRGIDGAPLETVLPASRTMRNVPGPRGGPREWPSR